MRRRIERHRRGARLRSLRLARMARSSATASSLTVLRNRHRVTVLNRFRRIRSVPAKGQGTVHDLQNGLSFGVNENRVSVIKVKA